MVIKREQIAQRFGCIAQPHARQFRRRIAKGRHFKVDQAGDVVALKHELPGIAVDKGSPGAVLWDMAFQPPAHKAHQRPGSADQRIEYRFGRDVEVAGNGISANGNVQPNRCELIERDLMLARDDFDELLAHTLAGGRVGYRFGVDRAGQAFEHQRAGIINHCNGPGRGDAIGEIGAVDCRLLRHVDGRHIIVAARPANVEREACAVRLDIRVPADPPACVTTKTDHAAQIGAQPVMDGAVHIAVYGDGLLVVRHGLPRSAANRVKHRLFMLILA